MQIINTKRFDLEPQSERTVCFHMNDILIYICLGLMLVTGTAAVVSRKMITSALWLAATSVIAGVIMFLMRAIWVAVFEISVCSGLVMIVLIYSISLTKNDKNNNDIDASSADNVSKIDENRESEANEEKESENGDIDDDAILSGALYGENEPVGDRNHNRRIKVLLPIILVVIGAVLVTLALIYNFDIVKTADDTGFDLRDVLWETHRADIWGQMIIIVTGAAAIVILFRNKRK